jgi:thiamine-phosphate pyrophosphorylase
MSAIPLPSVMLVTDLAVAGSAGRLVGIVEAAVRGGVNMVQLREKHLPSGELLALAERLRTATRDRTLLFVNDHIDIALACGADGVQLGEMSLSVQAARQTIGTRGMLIGRSVHSAQSASDAQNGGADLLVAGTIYPSQTHAGEAASGVSLIRDIVQRVQVPMLGIGGITAANAAEVIAAGASGVAVIRELLAANDPEAATRALRQAVQRAWAARAQEATKR